jgi:riboflavin synthase
MPDDLVRYVADKGSICINGTSLTVNRTAGRRFTVNIVPHTLQETMLGALQAGHRVNLEVDVIARYLEKLVRGGDPETCIDLELLKRTGFSR